MSASHTTSISSKYNNEGHENHDTRVAFRQDSLELEKAHAPTAETDIADGGREAWLTVLGAWLTVFATFGYANAFGVFQDLYTRHGTASASGVSWIGSVQFFFLVAAGLPAGKLLDAGHLRPLMFFASLLFVFSNFMLSLAHLDHYYQILLSQGFGVGIGAGMLYMPSFAVQAYHWDRYKPAIMGIVSTGGACGGFVFPIMLNKLINGNVGFEWGVRAASFLCLGCLVIANLIISPGKSKTKSNVGQQPPHLGAIIKEWPYMLGNVSMLILQAGLYFPIFYIQLFARLKGVNDTLSFYLLTVLNGSSMFGRLLAGIFATRLGVLNLLIPVSAICGALILALFGVHNAAGVVIFAILYGFFSGSVLSLLAPAVTVFTRNPTEIGIRMGISFFVSAFGILAGTPIDGALLPGPILQYPWHRPIIFSSIMCFAGAVGAIITRFGQAPRNGTWRL